jgi:hypothetical protein
MSNGILTPQEVAERKSRSAQPMKPTIDLATGVIAENNSTSVKIDFETMGRFSIPESLYVEDWDTEDVNNLTFCNEDNIFETLVAIINKNVKDQAFKVEDMLLEEFLEVMIGIKASFDSPIHIHRWACDCQADMDDKDRTIHEYPIDLKTINYVSILEADEKLKQYYKKLFESLTREQFAELMITKYGDAMKDTVADYTIEQELEKITVQDPLKQSINGKIYEFRLMRVGDLLIAQREANKKFIYNQKVLNSKKYRKELGELAAFKSNQEEQLKKLQEEKAKETLLYAQASTIVAVDGQPLTGIQEKAIAYKDIKRGDRLNFLAFLEEITFGIKNEMNLVCPLCGREEKRTFRKELNPLEFIPISNDTTDKLRGNSTGYIFM